MYGAVGITGCVGIIAVWGDGKPYGAGIFKREKSNLNHPENTLQQCCSKTLTIKLKWMITSYFRLALPASDNFDRIDELQNLDAAFEAESTGLGWQ